MCRTILFAGAALSLAGTGAALAQVQPAAPPTPSVASPLAAVLDGKPILEVRPRYEGVDQAKTQTLTDNAQAETIRFHFGWQTEIWEHFQALVEGANVTAIGPERYGVNVPGAATPPLNGADKSRYPLINDPPVTELNRAQLTWSPSAMFSATVGRQFILIDDQRFIGNVNWRQDQQTFDAIRLDGAFGKLHLFYAYIDRVNRILAEDRDFRSESSLFNFRYDLNKALSVEAFEYLLDFGNSTVNSSETRGVRAGGKSAAGPVGLAYDATYAHQGDYGSAPTTFGLDFYAADLTATYSLFTARLDYEQLNGNRTIGFTTPLATTYNFQGWADAFVAPGGNKSFVDGIDDYNVSVSVKPPLNLRYFFKPEVLARTYDFKDEHFGSDVGHEWDLSASAFVTDRLSMLLRYAAFKRDASVPAGAATPPASRTKVWLMADFNY